MLLGHIFYFFLQSVSARKDDGILNDEEWWNKYGKKTVTIISHELNRRQFNDKNMPENSRIAGGWIEGSQTANDWVRYLFVQ